MEEEEEEAMMGRSSKKGPTTYVRMYRSCAAWPSLVCLPVLTCLPPESLCTAWGAKAVTSAPLSKFSPSSIRGPTLERTSWTGPHWTTGMYLNCIASHGETIAEPTLDLNTGHWTAATTTSSTQLKQRMSAVLSTVL